MAVIRKYHKGDIESIEFNSIGRQDWADDGSKSPLEDGEAYTVEVGEYKCIVCVEPQDNGTYYLWFTADRRINQMYLKYVKLILDWAATRGTVWSLSRGGKCQDKMHRFLGVKKQGKFEGRTLWVKA